MKVQEKKDALKKMQELDAANKKQAAGQSQSNALIPKKDFDDRNVFTYVYETKVHKSHALREKNDMRQKAIQDCFDSPKKMTFEDEARIAEYHQKVKNDKDEQVQVQRKEKRKALELEAKLYQDGQNAQKKELIRQKTVAKVQEFAEIEVKVKEYEQNEAETKLQKLAKNKAHLAEMRKQGSLPVSGVFAKTGVGIVKSP